jgi:hypothetical protein
MWKFGSGPAIESIRHIKYKTVCVCVCVFHLRVQSIGAGNEELCLLCCCCCCQGD